MKTRRRLLTPVVLSLLIGLMVGLAGGPPPAEAAPTSDVVVPIGGTLDGSPESVYLSGLAHITTTLVTDPDFGQPPAVLLSIDLSNVSGVGLSTGMAYLATGEETLIRPLVASDLIEVTFPIVPNASGGGAAARRAVASFTLTFDLSTGAIASTAASLLSFP